MKGITKRHNNFRACVMVSGRRFSKTFTTQQEAEAFIRKMRLDTPQAEPDQDAWTITDTLTHYVTDKLIPNGGAYSTGATMMGRSTHLRGFFEDLPLHAITGPDLQKFVAYSHGKGLSPTTTRNDLRMILCLLRFGKDVGRYPSDIPKAPRIKVPPRPVRFINDTEEVALLEAAQRVPEFRDLLIVLMDTGMRINCEALALRWDNVDLTQRVIHIWNSKGTTSRTIPMTDRVLDILQRLAQRSPKYTGPFSPIPYTHCVRHWNRIRSVLGRSEDSAFTLHILRHTFCTRLAANGVEMRTIMELAGHSDISTTMMYAHFIPARLAGAIDTLNRTEADLS